VEAALSYGDARLRSALAKKSFSSRLVHLSLHPYANFVVQRLIGTLCKSRQTAPLELVLAELIPHTEVLMAAHKEGVVLAMVRAVTAAVESRDGGGDPPPSGLTQYQDSLFMHLAAISSRGGGVASLRSLLSKSDALLLASASSGKTLELSKIFSPTWTNNKSGSTMGAEGEEEVLNHQLRTLASESLKPKNPSFARWWLNIHFARCGWSSKSGDAEDDRAAPRTTSSSTPSNSNKSLALTPLSLSPLGASILASTLRFKPVHAKRVVDSLLALPHEELVSLSGDPFGSRHLLEPLIESPPVELASFPIKLAAALKGSFVTLSAGRFSVWVVSKLFTALDPRRKAAIAGEVSDGERAISGTPGGKTLVKNMRLEHFRSNVEGWQASWAKDATKRAAFSEFFAPAENAGSSSNKGHYGGETSKNEGKDMQKRAAEQLDMDASMIGSEPKANEPQETNESVNKKAEAAAARKAARKAEKRERKALEVETRVVEVKMEDAVARKAAEREEKKASKKATKKQIKMDKADKEELVGKRNRKGSVSEDSSESEGERERGAKIASMGPDPHETLLAQALPSHGGNVQVKSDGVKGDHFLLSGPGAKDAPIVAAALAKLAPLLESSSLNPNDDFYGDLCLGGKDKEGEDGDERKDTVGSLSLFGGTKKSSKVGAKRKRVN